MKSKFEHVIFWYSLGVLRILQGLIQVFGIGKGERETVIGVLYASPPESHCLTTSPSL